MNYFRQTISVLAILIAIFTGESNSACVAKNGTVALTQNQLRAPRVMVWWWPALTTIYWGSKS
jgi:hypothetical protein